MLKSRMSKGKQIEYLHYCLSRSGTSVETTYFQLRHHRNPYSSAERLHSCLFFGLCNKKKYWGRKKKAVQNESGKGQMKRKQKREMKKGGFLFVYFFLSLTFIITPASLFLLFWVLCRGFD